MAWSPLALQRQNRVGSPTRRLRHFQFLPTLRRHLRRQNGLPMSFPVWMTDSSAADIEITRDPRLAFAALLELRRLTSTCLSSLATNESDGDRDAPTGDRARATIRREQDGSCTAATEGGNPSSDRRTDKLAECAREDDRDRGDWR